MNDAKALDSLKYILQNEVDKQGNLIPDAPMVNLLGHIQIYEIIKEYIQLCTDEANCISTDVRKMIHKEQENKINQLLLYRICSKELIQEMYELRKSNYET